MAVCALVSANLGGLDKPNPYAITEQDFPLRFQSMTPRLQARIVKMFMWQFKPGYEYYLWVDSSCILAPGGMEWFREKLGDHDIAVFKHPHRQTIQEEADYLRERLALEKSGKKRKYLLQRYENEDIDGQLAEVDPEAPLLASTAFIYRDSPAMRAAMKEWWYHTSRYHSIDQLSFSHAIQYLDVAVIPDNYEKCAGLEYVRNK